MVFAGADRMDCKLSSCMSGSMRNVRPRPGLVWGLLEGDLSATVAERESFGRAPAGAVEFNVFVLGILERGLWLLEATLCGGSIIVDVIENVERGGKRRTRDRNGAGKRKKAMVKNKGYQSIWRTASRRKRGLDVLTTL